MGKEVDTNGFWRIKDNPLSKEGVFPYLGKQIDAKLEPNKIYWVYRPMSELSKPETVESFNAVPMIDEHEMIGEGWTPYDDRPAGGVIYNTQAKDGKLYGDIRIFSEKLKEEIESGKKELSMGYECSYEPEHGIFEGKEYDFVQRNLRGNHVALVNRGRMGHDVRVYDHYTFDTLEGLGEFVAEDREYVRDNLGRFAQTNGTGSEEHITEISGDEFGEFTGDKKDYIKRFSDYYKKNISGKSVNNPVLGEIKFFNSAIGETKDKNYKTPQNLKYIVGIPDLIEHSRDVKEEGLKHPKKDIIGVWRVKGKIKVRSENPRMVEVIVLEDNQHNRFYTFDARKEIPQADTTVLRGLKEGFDSLRTVSVTNQSVGGLSNNNVTQDEYDVNIYLSGGDGTMTENDISAMDREWNEADHPRDEKGQFTDSGGSSSGLPSGKIARLKEQKKDTEYLISQSKEAINLIKEQIEHEKDIADESRMHKLERELAFNEKQLKENENFLEEIRKALAQDEIPSEDGSPKESGVYGALNNRGDTKVDNQEETKVEDAKAACKDDCTTKKEEVKDDSGVAKKDAEGEAPTEEKKDEGKKEDKKAEDAMIAVADALPEILKSLNEIKASLAQKQSAADSAPIMYGLDEEASAYNPKEDKVLKKYLGED